MSLSGQSKQQQLAGISAVQYLLRSNIWSFHNTLSVTTEVYPSDFIKQGLQKLTYHSY